MILRGIAICSGLVMMLSCAHQSTVDALTTQVAGLQQEVVELKEMQKNVCMMTAEMSTSGMMIYLGDDLWLNQASGISKRFPELDDACLKAVGEFKEVVESRAEQKALIEKQLVETIPVVIE